MSYLKKLEYELVLNESFLIVRRCSGCGRKTRFQNAKKFRVNANGNRLDVWLIYQCELCKHTYNLAIYERQSVSSIPKEEYLCFWRMMRSLRRSLVKICNYFGIIRLM